MIEEGHLKIYDDSKLERERKELARLVNGLYRSKKKRLKVLQDGEIGALVLANSLGSSALVVDERTTRMILERPRELAELFKKKMHREVWLDDKALERFLDKYGKVKIIRSVEMGVVAYELGFLDKYIIRKGKKKNELRKDLLDAFLWGFKLRGCAISVDEINSILTIEKV